MEEQVTISKAEYRELLNIQARLDCLEASGVDNWCGYDEAMEYYEEMINDDDDD